MLWASIALTLATPLWQASLQSLWNSYRLFSMWRCVSSSISPKGHTSHRYTLIWIKFRSEMRACRATSWSAAIYLNSIIRAYVPRRPPHSSKERHLALPTERVEQATQMPSQQGCLSLSPRTSWRLINVESTSSPITLCHPYIFDQQALTVHFWCTSPPKLCLIELI